MIEWLMNMIEAQQLVTLELVTGTTVSGLPVALSKAGDSFSLAIPADDEEDDEAPESDDLAFLVVRIEHITYGRISA